MKGLLLSSIFQEEKYVLFHMQPEGDLLKAVWQLGVNVPSDNMVLENTEIMLFSLIGWTQHPALSAE